MIYRNRTRGGSLWAVLVGLALILDGAVRVLSLGRFATTLPRSAVAREGLAALRRDPARER